MLAHAPREGELFPATLVDRSGDDLPALAVLEIRIGILHEHAAANPLVVARLGVGAAALAVEEDARILLLLQRRQGRVVVAG